MIVLHLRHQSWRESMWTCHWWRSKTVHGLVTCRSCRSFSAAGSGSINDVFAEKAGVWVTASPSPWSSVHLWTFSDLRVWRWTLSILNFLLHHCCCCRGCDGGRLSWRSSSSSEQRRREKMMKMMLERRLRTLWFMSVYSDMFYQQEAVTALYRTFDVTWLS